MPIVKEPEGREFPLAPEGVHLAVCVDVWEIWTDERGKEWGGGLVDRTRLVWQLQDTDPNGVPYEVSKRYTASLHEKSNLRKDLEAWRGRRFTPEELRGFDLDTVIGASCQLQLIHNTSKTNGKIYANISGIMPLPKGVAKIVPAPGYVRKKDRAGNSTKPQNHETHGYDEDDVSGVPF